MAAPIQYYSMHEYQIQINFERSWPVVLANIPGDPSVIKILSQTGAPVQVRKRHETQQN